MHYSSQIVHSIARWIRSMTIFCYVSVRANVDLLLQLQFVILRLKSPVLVLHTCMYIYFCRLSRTASSNSHPTAHFPHTRRLPVPLLPFCDQRGTGTRTVLDFLGGHRPVAGKRIYRKGFTFKINIICVFIYTFTPILGFDCLIITPYTTDLKWFLVIWGPV